MFCTDVKIKFNDMSNVFDFEIQKKNRKRPWYLMEQSAENEVENRIHRYCTKIYFPFKIEVKNSVRALKVKMKNYRD